MPLLTRDPHRLNLDLTPLEVAARCRHLPGFVFFDTALEARGKGNLSIVAAAPREVFRGRSDVEWQAFAGNLRAHSTGPRTDDGLPLGFAAGWVEYDGTFCFGLYEDALIYRHDDDSWHEVGALWEKAIGMSGVTEHSACGRPQFAVEMASEDYCAKVRRAQEYIAAGDIYQVNLAHRFSAEWSGDTWAFYEALRHYSPAPHAACLSLVGRTVLSSSPETFLRLSGNSIRTRPIKGTRPRRADATADEKSAYDLITSPKELAELLMITDLERNDLGRVCEYGSVAVPELLALERYEQVFHLVSTVEGRLREDVDHVAALRACFPGGSITGAPKKRAREIIAELETVPRGLYTGAIGWFGFNGESQFSIAIRTAIAEDGRIHCHTGAGIVADSDPAREWQETLDKAAGILLAAERMG